VFTARYGLNLRVMYINPSKPSGQYVPQGSTLNKSMFCPHSVFMCFGGTMNKQRQFPYTLVTDWFLGEFAKLSDC